MTITVPTWTVALLILGVLLAAMWWVDRHFLKPGMDRVVERLLRWRRSRIKGIPCDCGHDDLLHMGLTGRCLAPKDGGWADNCKSFRRPR